jgi:DNA-binding NtrC family response regulator
VKDEVRTYADSDTEVLITGPTGVGKDHVAMALHYESRRRNEPFKNVSCPLYQETLIESALFGHERGAFTGAYKRKEGVIEAAGKGTVLLNEFVEIPRHVQAKFLVVLDSGVFSRLGEEGRDRRTHARFIGATNADLDRAKDSGALREDLLWRLKKIWIRIPPLKERGEDVILLAEHFIEKECRALGKPAFPLSQRSKDILMDYEWPGNVRQLGGFIGMLVQSGRDEVVEPPRTLAESAREDGDNGGPVNLKVKLKEQKEDLERAEIERALGEFRGSRKKAAGHLGMSYRTLLYKMKRYGLREKY